ncbi:hypothetical protein AZE42_11512 [Rhizopogon vesiculosus]|uniref:Uncharacterized protein n=1 Tax=Rhizopogon vesiculosus TaxID=180088 RepID=A0A1J8Q6P8_9AGAM|nr:hypothetical protein AZE42_11512 [Rhizopogon vesiculosus]
MIENRDWLTLFGHPYALLASSSGLTVKALITIFIAYFLRSNRSQMPGRENYTRQLKRVFMEMGLMTYSKRSVAFAPQFDSYTTLSVGPRITFDKELLQLYACCAQHTKGYPTASG